jgi:hypothetical protein
MRIPKLWRHLAVSLIAGIPSGGFLFGLVKGGDPDPNPVGRIVYAFIMAAMTPLHVGFPPNVEAGAGKSFNTWPHIAISSLLILSCFLYRDWKSSKNRREPSA